MSDEAQALLFMGQVWLALDQERLQRMDSVLNVLQERGFIDQVSDEEELRVVLQQPITCYIGFDPTASSLHAGSSVPIMALVHLQRHGHRPIAVVGGGTGLVGDPSFRAETRKLLSIEDIEHNLAGQRAQLSRYLDFGDDKALMVNNADWLTELKYLEFLREIGRHFSVNRMLAAEAYRVRLETGLSFIEFNYMLLQAYDFLHLYREYGCVLQLGGSDQWGNILAGVDLVRRVEGKTVYATVFPLLTTASGAKMGKTEGGAVWLDAERLSPYDFYQYWINTEDPDVERFLALFTLLPMDEVRRLGSLEGAGIRDAKEVLAYEATRITHGEQEALKAQQASRQLFGGDVGDATGAPTTSIEQAKLAAGISATDLIRQVGLCASTSEARRVIKQGGAYVNDERIASHDQRIGVDHLRDGVISLRVGKKRYHRVIPG